ncbi:zinc-finger associated domain (zf-AD) domain-containing protein [Phthorimaea operculella]|nr:zinc-finger associated domain (zf-AD) domain-containing protein [Phthorimaea operculella]
MDTPEPQAPVKTSLNTLKPKKNVIVIKRQALTTKKAIELLLNGTLKSKVCRYCLFITSPLSEMDQIMQIAGKGALYKVTIKDIVASVHPFKVPNDPNFPNKICEKCLNKALQSYLFAQKCEQSGRALHNCFEDMYDKLEKLDPLERVKKRGRQKLHPNHNILYTENRNVIDYAEPIHNLINIGSVSFTNEPFMHDLECKKCWQVLPNVESLANHEKMHPKSMWFNCRICGKAFAKKIHIKRHLKIHAKGNVNTADEKDGKFVCKKCGHSTDDHNVHLQHIEKHKFQTVLEHLVERKMDKLCSVCLSGNGKMIEMDKMICLHGGYPELTGDRSLYNILGSTIPEMNILHNHTGSKICEKCLDHAITSYIFINKTHYIRNRLDTCITNMIESLKCAQPEKRVFIEITQNCIMPITESYDENLLLEEDEVDETKLKVDVLEDEFRIEDDESSSDEKDVKPVVMNGDVEIKTEPTKLINGYKIRSDICEFLTFKKEKLKPKKQKYRVDSVTRPYDRGLRPPPETTRVDPS